MGDYDDNCKDVDVHDIMILILTAIMIKGAMYCNMGKFTLEKWRQQYLKREVDSYCVYTVFNDEHYYFLLMYNRYVNTIN